MFFFLSALAEHSAPKVVIRYGAPTIRRVNIVTNAAATASVAAGDRHKINAFETRITYSGKQLGIIFINIIPHAPLPCIIMQPNRYTDNAHTYFSFTCKQAPIHNIIGYTLYVRCR